MSEPLTDAELDDIEAFWTSGARAVAYQGVAQDMLRLIAEVRRLRAEARQKELHRELIWKDRAQVRGILARYANPLVSWDGGNAARGYFGLPSRDTGEESEP